MAHFDSFEIQTVFSPCSKSFSVLRGEDFGVFSLNIHLTLFIKKVEKISVLRWNNADLGEKSAVFSNGEKRLENSWRNALNDLFSLLRRGNLAKRRTRVSAVV